LIHFYKRDTLNLNELMENGTELSTKMYITD